MAEAYNATANAPRTLIGNWQEEATLVGVTGTARCKLTSAGVAGGSIPSSAVHEPTHQRVIQHTEREEPGAWASHNAASFQIPHKRIDLLSYPKVLGCGPRQAQELQQMWQQAAVVQEAAEEARPWETTQQAEFQPKTMDGLQVGSRVMNPDGSPASRDPVFLQEAGIVPNAGRLLSKAPSFGYVRPHTSSQGLGTVSGLKHSSLDPAVPITMYTEAAAKATYNATFYGTATLGKGLMNRNDQFTKLMGDVNKDQRLL